MSVHKIEEDKTVVRVGDNLVAFNAHTMEQMGIAGDDFVGIYLALQCLKHFDNIKVMFTVQEEVGAIGAYEADVTFFDDVMFVLQGDRRGNSDFVVEASGTQLSNEKFQEAVLPALYNHGYSFAHGMMTDVMALREIGIECSMANVSCGYYNPHCKDEYVNIPDVENTLSLFKEIISTLNDDFDFVGDIKKPYSYYWDKQPAEELCMDCYALPVKHSHLCEECLKWYEPGEILPYKEDDFEEFIELCNKKK